MRFSEVLTKNNFPSQRPALVFNDRAISFQQLKEAAFTLARSLIKLGVKKGDKVAIYLPNCPEYAYSYLAIWLCGATAVPLDFMLTDEELVSCIDHSETKVLIAKAKPNNFLSTIQEKCPILDKIVVFQRQDTSYLSFEDLLQGDSKPLEVEVDQKDIAIIFYTSGTTGKPKGVLVNYLQLGAPPKAMEYFARLKAEDTALCALPFSHLGGLVFLQSMVYLGAKVVLMDRFIPVEFLKNVQQHKVTCFWLVPSMYYAILQLKEFESFDLSSLHWLVSFGAPSSADQLRRFHQHCPQAFFYHGWGMTETNAPTVVIPYGSNKIESIGKAAPWIEVKIFDEGDKEVAAGGVGEIVARGWVVTDGYYKDPELTRQTLRNGWFHTGDLGRFDDEGFLYIAGRKKEMIKVAGEIVFEPEVEAAIHKHADVAEVAVIGITDRLRGEAPKALIVLKEGAKLNADDLRFFLRRHLAHFKIPHIFSFVSGLPKNRAGKIDKEQLRKGAVL